jgi:CO/xanthine dehydrogenase Mo-binding subunit
MAVPRKEGLDKVTGQAQYIDDLSLPDMLYGATVRSHIPRGKIKEITFGSGIPWNEIVVVSAKDIPGQNCVALIVDDQPCLADGVVNHPEEPILLLAHPNGHLLPKAVRAISIEYAPLPALFTIEEASGARRSSGERQYLQDVPDREGDVDSVWAQADYIVEGEYTTGAQEQLYIENNGVIASFDPTGNHAVGAPYNVHITCTGR